VQHVQWCDHGVICINAQAAKHFDFLVSLIVNLII